MIRKIESGRKREIVIKRGSERENMRKRVFEKDKK
jgi:hypothetical protein